MTEEKKQDTEKTNPVVEPVVKEEEKIQSITEMDEPVVNAGNPLNMIEELPEEIRKKLEKSKEDRKVNKKKGRKKKIDKKVPAGVAHVKATYNNTIVALTDLSGNVISWASAGMAGFKGPKKSTPYAAQIITRIAVERAKEFGLTEVSVMVKGVGTGRESAIRALNANGLIITSIKDITPIPHNGCRPKKPRRV